MQREFLQEKSLSRRQGNAEKSLNIDLSSKSRLIPYSTTASMFGLNDLYIEERDACENYRMVFTVNPVCSNVLYNSVTEPVYKEGSYSALTLVETPVTRTSEIFPYSAFGGTLNQSGGDIDQVFAVRDTEISHEKIGNFKYHCGYDIFNNHLLRSSEFEHVAMEKDKGNKNEFNTIFDFAVDYNGKRTQRVIGESTGPAYSIAKTGIRMYSLDTIKPMSTAFYDEMRSVDGWYGFYNSGYIEIPNAEIKKNEDISVNKILNNENRCGFIDLYPDRTLYSFIPKVNRYKKRIERNWDCAIVYPYENDYDKFAEINENSANAVKILSDKIVYNNVGDEQIQMKSLLRHSLRPGDRVRLFYRGETVGLTRYSVPVTVIAVGSEKGDELNRYFKVNFSDLATFLDIETDENGKKYTVIRRTAEKPQFFYKKIEGGYDDRYYFRKFKVFKNYQYVQCEEQGDEVVITKEPTVVNENSPERIKFGDECFELQGKPLAYTQNKIAFAGNIYGDRVAQVIFNDDICVTGLKDNLGRPLSTVYFMAVKTNRGHKEWYENKNFSGDTVEYSHCFGEVTSGLDLPADDTSTEYNVRKLHNVFKEDLVNQNYADGLKEAMKNAPEGNYSGTPTPLESGITLSADTVDDFYGDIVEFNRPAYQERIIEKVYHRFNTAQRELLKNDKYFDIHYDDLVGDLYDVDQVND